MRNRAILLLRDILDNTLIGEYEEYHAKIKEILKKRGDNLTSPSGNDKQEG
jgi:hypothetical protein